MLKLGVIGLGVGAYHADAVVNSGLAKIVSLCDTDAETLNKYAEKYHVTKCSADYKDMLADPEVDGVCIATPDNLHCEMVLDALKAGKHVLCEKPLALHADECKTMIDAADRSDKIFMVGQVCRVTPGFVKAKELVDAGYLGDLFFIESEYAHDYTEIRGWRMDLDMKRHPVTGGGCHPIDLVRWITGKEPQEVFSYSTHKGLPDWPCDDTTIATIKFDEGLAGKVYISTGCKRDYTMRTVIYGTKGTIIVNNTDPYLSLFVDSFEGKERFAGAKMHEIEHRIPVSVNNHNFNAEIIEFCNCIINNEQPKISAEEGARAVAICEAIIRSSESGNPEKVIY